MHSMTFSHEASLSQRLAPSYTRPLNIIQAAHPIIWSVLKYMSPATIMLGALMGLISIEDKVTLADISVD